MTKKEKDEGPRIALRLTNPETIARVERLKTLGFNISEVARRILDEGLERFEKENIKK